MFLHERHPVDVTYAGKAYRFYARELGYLHLQELFSKKHADAPNANIARMNEIMQASLENEDGSALFPDASALRDAPRAIYEACFQAAMKAQGMEIGETEGKPVSEGNGKRSRTSGMS